MGAGSGAFLATGYAQWLATHRYRRTLAHPVPALGSPRRLAGIVLPDLDPDQYSSVSRCREASCSARSPTMADRIQLFAVLVAGRQNRWNTLRRQRRLERPEQKVASLSFLRFQLRSRGNRNAFSLSRSPRKVLGAFWWSIIATLASTATAKIG